MRHVSDSLKPVTIDNAKRRENACALLDGGGLQIEIFPSGGKTWRFKHQPNGKRDKVTIGAYPSFTIMQARVATKRCARWCPEVRALRRQSGRQRPNRNLSKPAG